MNKTIPMIACLNRIAPVYRSFHPTLSLIRSVLFAMSLCLVFGPGLVMAQSLPAQRQQKPMVILGATLHPVSSPPIENATLLFDQGKITALGQTVKIPLNAEVIDAKGKHVYPGLINAYSSVGLQEIGSVDMTIDLNETGLINPNIRAEVAVNAESELIPTTRANGIMISAVYPQGGMIAGTAAVLELDGWTWEEMTLKPGIGMVINYPDIIPRQGRFLRQSKEEFQKRRDQQLLALDNAFSEARAYWRARNAASTPRGPSVETDVRWDAMQHVLEGKTPLYIMANEAAQMESAIAFVETKGLKCVIVGGYDAWKIAPLLREKNIPVVITKIHRLPARRSDDYDLPFSLPAKLRDAGVRFAIADNASGEQERNLPYNAGTAVAYGLKKEDALRAITLSAAEILGIDSRVGSLDVGKDATFIITDGDPLEIMTRVEHAFIQGKAIDLTSKHTRLYEKYKKRYGQ